MSHTSLGSGVGLPPPPARRVPRPSRGDGWNILVDIEVLVVAVETELKAMDLSESRCLVAAASRT